MRIYYFGCDKESGHFLFIPGMHGTISPKISGLPWGHLGGPLCPQTTPQEGVAKIHQKDGWTALGFWDRSVDSWIGSNSVFFYEDLLDFDQMISAFKEHFPVIFSRFQFPITELPSDE